MRAANSLSLSLGGRGCIANAVGIRVLYTKNGQRKALAYGGGEAERGRVRGQVPIERHSPPHPSPLPDGERESRRIRGAVSAYPQPLRRGFVYHPGVSRKGFGG